MALFDKQKTDLLRKIADIDGIPDGAFNIRLDGVSVKKAESENIKIVKKTDRDGIDIYIKPYTVNENVHIPVVISKSGISELVYNDFHIGEGAVVTIVAGCGIHNDGDCESKHDGVHSFYLEKNSKVTYIEKHVGEGDGEGGKVMNPTTYAHLGENAYMEMRTQQIGGIDSTNRTTRVELDKGATLVIGENIMTHGHQRANTNFVLDLNGEGSGAHVVSRSVARDDSFQSYESLVNGNCRCSGHTECDAIIMDRGVVTAIPKINANSVDASLIHEAAIGKIAGEQLIKLMTLGLTEKEAETAIINGFLG